MSDENKNKYDQARDNAAKMLADARAEVERTKAANDQCQEELEEAQENYDEAVNFINENDPEDILRREAEFQDAKKKKEAAEQMEEIAKKNAAKAVRQASARNVDLNEAKAQMGDGVVEYWMAGGRKMIKERQQNFDQAHAKMVSANKALQNARNQVAMTTQRFEEAEKNKPSKDEVKMAENIDTVLEDAKIALDNKTEECEKTKEALDEAEAALSGLGYDENDIANLGDLIRRAKKKYNGVGTAWAQNPLNQTPTQIMDLRNLDSTNFRAVGNTGGLNAMDKGGAALNPSRSFYMNEDYLFTDSLASPTLDAAVFKYKPELQTLILSEFQPYDMLSIKDLLPRSADALGSIVNVGTKVIGNTIISIAKNSLINGYIDTYSQDPTQLYDMEWRGGGGGNSRTRSYFTPDPVQQVQNMFNGGKWLNTYELPFWGGDYLNGTFSKTWQIGPQKEMMGELIGGQLDNLGVDFPANPKFKPVMSQSRPELKTEFYLINSSSTWLKKNFEFIQAIFAGTMWLHMKYCMIRPPNVFHVLCPGRFQIYWAALDVVVTFAGKLRKNRAVSNSLMGLGIKSIDEDMLWPDAWKMSITIRDLTPNNFNLYAEYYRHGYNEEEVSSLGKMITVDEMVDEVGDYFNEVLNDTVNAAKATGNTLKRTGQKLLDKLKQADKRAQEEMKQASMTGEEKAAAQREAYLRSQRIRQKRTAT